MGKKKVTVKEVLVFTQKLTTLSRAKVELLSSIKILYEQTESPRFKEVILEVYNGTKEGKPFSESLSHFPGVFSPLYVNLVRSGEASGHLDVALEQVSEFLYREESLKSKILVAMAYPALLLSVGLVSIFVLINFVIPKLKPMFDGLGGKLPLITKIILNLSALSNKSWVYIFGALAAAVAFLYFQKGSKFFGGIIRNVKMHLPVVSRLSRNQEMTHFARSLGLLLNSGVAALKAIEIATLTVENPRSKEELKKVYQEVAQGQRLSKSMEDHTHLPSFFVKMVAVGEESGRLGEVLEEIARSYTQQLEGDIALISSLIEPILILSLGLVLGTIVLAILLPTFQVTQIVH
jgi:type II secretory pathway component PulF